MKKNYLLKKGLVLVMVCLLICWAAVSVSAAVGGEVVYKNDEGTVSTSDGGSLKWVYGTINYERVSGDIGEIRGLVISGNGAIPDYAPEYCSAFGYKPVPPWIQYARSYEAAYVMSGITSIGQYAFCCRTMSSVFLQDGVKEIKDYAFGQCWSLYRVVIPDSVTSISDKAFDGLEGVVFYCSSNSYARKYADAHGIDVSLTDECHHAKYSIKVTKEAGCTENGTKSEICDSCGKVLRTFSIDALGHSYGNWETKTNATVFEPEVQIRTCTRCGNTETRQAGGKLSPTIKVNTKSIKIKTGQTTSALKVSGLANGDYVKAYSSLNRNIATVDTQGRIKAGKRTGSTQIRIQLASGGCAYVQVTVQKKAVALQKISGVPSALTLSAGKTRTLKPKLLPVTCTQKITYKSSNKNVVTVNKKGKLTAKKRGKAVITVTAGNKAVKCKVTVK